EEFTRIWGQLARWASSSDVEHDLDVSLTVVGSSVVVSAVATSDGGDSRGNRELELLVDGELSARLWQVSPDRYVGAVDLGTTGIHEVAVEVSGGNTLLQPVVRNVLTKPVHSGLTEAAAILVEGTGGSFLSPGDGLPATPTG